MKKYSWLLVLASAILWGSNGIFINLLSDSGLSGFEMTSIRLIIACIIDVILILIIDRKLFEIDKKDLIWFALVGSIGIFAFIITYSLSIQYVGMATAAVLIYLMPSLVLVYSFLFLSEKVTVIKIISVILSLFGCALASGILNGVSTNSTGIILGLVSAVCYAFNNITVSVKLGAYKPLTRMLYTYIFAMICSIIYLIFFTDGVAALSICFRKPSNITTLILWAVCCSICTYYLFYNGLNYMSVSKASLISTFEPVAAALFGFFLLNENIGLPVMIGMVLVVVSIVINELFSKD